MTVVVAVAEGTDGGVVGKGGIVSAFGRSLRFPLLLDKRRRNVGFLINDGPLLRVGVVGCVVGGVVGVSCTAAHVSRVQGILLVCLKYSPGSFGSGSGQTGLVKSSDPRVNDSEDFLARLPTLLD